MLFLRCRYSVLLLSTIALQAHFCSTFYLPGVIPTSYKEGDRVQLYVNRVTPSSSTNDPHLRSILSYDYYDPDFHFCQPEGGPKTQDESLGSVLFGDRIYSSPFELFMHKNQVCKKLCSSIFDQESAIFVNNIIYQSYDMNWIIDGLPAGQEEMDEITNTTFYSPGFALGDATADEPRLNNHFDITIDYHTVEENAHRVVGVLVEPSSRAETGSNGGCEEEVPPMVLSEHGQTQVIWTYSVYWRPSDTVFATRWDKYLHVSDPRIHWFSLITSAISVVVLTMIISSILLRALRRDFARYNRLNQFELEDISGAGTITEDGIQEDSGWKLVHGDAFRTPSHPLLLSVFLGNGAQLFVMTGVTIIFALFGLVSPASRGMLTTIMVIFYALFGFIGGYVSARVYKHFGGESWKQNIAYTPLLIPGIVFSTFFMLNLFLWAKRSSGAVPFTTMLVVVGIWFVVSVPLSFAGSWVGLKQQIIQPPVRTNQIPRQIPPAVGYLRPIPSVFLAGLLPFGSIFVELYLITNSIWSSKVYFMFGFLFLCYGLMVMTCAAVTILMVYFLLCSENYNWHWRAFFSAGAVAGYVFLNALLYWFTTLNLSGLAGNVLYLGYSALISFLFFILTGTIGFFASWAFVQTIYASIKID
ncbi:MAG: hypothetical protein M1829_004438 [Trizodia sp. TS-e1964]|nr:MAG: hypothetical protein M1829_004438 [Trizodia sp. TS-e1964]